MEQYEGEGGSHERMVGGERNESHGSKRRTQNIGQVVCKRVYAEGGSKETRSEHKDGMGYLGQEEEQHEEEQQEEQQEEEDKLQGSTVIRHWEQR